MQTNTVNDAALERFVAAAKQKLDLAQARNIKDAPIELGYETGQRYARVFMRNYYNHDADSRSVFCFVDLTNGNVLRPDGWKRPNLKVRNSIQGNVFDDQNGAGSIRGTRL
jgi:hypothetical protein